MASKLIIDRIPPDMHVDEKGNIVWTPRLIDFNSVAYSRGHVVTSDEFNTELIKQTYQGNYNTDTISVLIGLYNDLKTDVTNTANTANTNAVEALLKAGIAEANSIEALGTANDAFTTSTEALSDVQAAVNASVEAVTTSENALNISESAMSLAEDASDRADAAVLDAEEAMRIAEIADNTSVTAEEKAAQALSISQLASSTANSANTKSDSAVTSAENAVKTANEALKNVTESLGTQVTVGGQLVKTFNADSKLDATANAVSATKATQDGDGNVIKDTYLKLTGGALTGEITIGQGDGNGIQIGRNGVINATTSSGLTNRTILGLLTEDNLTIGNGSFNTLLRGKQTNPTYNGTNLALITDNVASATKATQDGDGNVISSTYVKTSTKYNRTSVNALTALATWAGNTNIPTLNTIAYWDGRYQTTNNASNIAYCKHGALGTMATKTATTRNFTLNGGTALPTYATGTTAASWYAPTTVGSANQILKSNGSGAPTWINQSAITAGSATKATKLSNTTAIGSANKPVYFNASGQPVAGNYTVSDWVNLVSKNINSSTLSTSKQTVDLESYLPSVGNGEIYEVVIGVSLFRESGTTAIRLATDLIGDINNASYCFNPIVNGESEYDRNYITVPLNRYVYYFATSTSSTDFGLRVYGYRRVK